MPVLDTTFLIDLASGLPSARKANQLLATQRLLLPSQCVMEFLAGYDDRHTVLDALAESYTLSWPDRSQTLAGADLAAKQRAQKKRPRWADIQVAACAHVHETFVVTANVRDFQALGCTVWDYRLGGTPPSAR